MPSTAIVRMVQMIELCVVRGGFAGNCKRARSGYQVAQAYSRLPRLAQASWGHSGRPPKAQIFLLAAFANMDSHCHTTIRKLALDTRVHNGPQKYRRIFIIENFCSERSSSLWPGLFFFSTALVVDKLVTLFRAAYHCRRLVTCFHGLDLRLRLKQQAGLMGEP